MLITAGNGHTYVLPIRQGFFYKKAYQHLSQKKIQARLRYTLHDLREAKEIAKPTDTYSIGRTIRRR
jgi:hypothetical protein